MRTGTRNTSSSNLEQIEWFALESVHVINEIIKLKKSDILTIETFFDDEVKSCIVKFKINKARLLDVSDYIYFLLDYELGDMIRHGMKFERELKDEVKIIKWESSEGSQTFHFNNKVACLIGVTKSNVMFKKYSKLNHLFMEGEGKSIPKEYEKASNIPPYVIDDISKWIKSL